MHFALIKKRPDGGYDIYNAHDDDNDVSSAEYLGFVLEDGTIEVPRKTEIAQDGIRQALTALGFREKNDSAKRDIMDRIHKCFSEMFTYDYATDLYYSKRNGKEMCEEVREELEKLMNCCGYQCLFVEDIKRIIGKVMLSRLEETSNE